MNCRPGDLAVIVGAGSHEWAADQVIGRFITVCETALVDGVLHWKIEPPIKLKPPRRWWHIRDRTMLAVSVCDSLVRPIRPGPQSDATETSQPREVAGVAP